MNDSIHFEVNVPQVLSLKETAGVIDGFHVLYETSDGRILQLPRPAAVQLGKVDPAPGEEISVTKYRKDREPASWVVCLTPKSEQERAERERNAEVLAETQKFCDSQKLTASVSQMPRMRRNGTQDPPVEPRGNGTYGPLPQVALAGRKQPPCRVSYRVALHQITETVLELLDSRKEQWESDPRQGLISTLFISACKAGAVVFDFQPGGEK